MSARVVEISHQGAVALRDMKIGQIGSFLYGGEKILVLRIYQQVVDLNRPSRTWGLSASHTVELLPDGSRVELVSEKLNEVVYES